jgi:hypothetical protein
MSLINYEPSTTNKLITYTIITSLKDYTNNNAEETISDTKQIKSIDEPKLNYSYSDWFGTNNRITNNITVTRFDVKPYSQDVLFECVNVLQSKDLTNIIIGYLTKCMHLRMYAEWWEAFEDKPSLTRETFDDVERKKLYIVVEYHRKKYYLEYFVASDTARLLITKFMNYRLFKIYLKSNYSLESLMQVAQNEIVSKSELGSLYNVLYIMDYTLQKIKSNMLKN